MPEISTNKPVLLFPLKIETRFVADKLRIRVFPDEINLHSHNPNLTSEERVDALSFQKLDRGKEETQKLSWDRLVAKYGAYRAAWLAQISPSTLSSEGVSKNNSSSNSDNDPEYYYSRLPEKFIVFLYPNKSDDPIRIEHNVIKNNNKLIAFGEGDEWVADFDEAKKAGMAFEIDADDLKNNTSFERIIVSGFYYEKDGADDGYESSEELAELFNNHLYTEGFEFLDYGSPTNNIDDEKSAYSIQDEFESTNSYQSSVSGYQLQSSDDKTLRIRSSPAGSKFAQSLGLKDKSFFNKVKNAEQTDSSLSYLLQRMSWFALGGETLKMLFGNRIDHTDHESIWNHFSEYTRAKGPFPAIKIGDQPYGILPVTQMRKLPKEVPEDQDSVLIKTHLVLSLMLDKWVEMINTGKDDSRVPRLQDSEDSYEELIEVLSMQASSSSLQIRTLAYERIRGKIPHWLQVAADIPGSLSNLPVGQVYEIIKEHASVEDYLNIANIDDSVSEITSVLDDFISQTSTNNQENGYDELLHSPLLSFTNRGDKQFNDSELSLLPDDFGPLRKFFVQLSADEENLTRPLSYTDEENNLLKTNFIYYRGETTLLTDLILQGYSNAAELYNTTVYFSPTTADIKGTRTLTIKKYDKTKVNINKGDVVLEVIPDGNENKKIEVKAPFGGEIESYKVNEKEEILPGQALFKIVDKVSYVRIMKQFVEMGESLLAVLDPTPTDEELKQTDKKDIEKAIYETIDLNSYRLDAWITGLATSRLEQLRQTEKKGIYLGAYGWVENLVKDEDKPVKDDLKDTNRNDDGGIIHCPSSAQSITATLFKNSFISNVDEEEASNPYTLKLTSERIQKSAELMQGIREDQTIEALLGYKLERLLHEAKLDSEISTLREAFPLEVNIINPDESEKDIGFTQLSVIDGLKAIKSKNQLPDQIINNKEVTECIDKIIDTLDGTIDHLLFEAGYQLTQGNPTRSGAAMDAAKGAQEPPETESLKTKIPGTGINHKLVYLFPQLINSYKATDGKAFIEPVLEDWLKNQLGPFNKIGGKVTLSKKDAVIETIEVKLSDLNINYLDFLHLSSNEVSDGSSELELRIWNYVKTQTEHDSDTRYLITEEAASNCQSLANALEVAQYAFQLLTKSRFARSEDLRTTGEIAEYDWGLLGKIKTGRFDTFNNQLVAWSKTPDAYIDILAKLNITEAKRAFLTKTPLDGQRIKAELNEVISRLKKHLDAFNKLFNTKKDYYLAFEQLRLAAKDLFGQSFILLPPASASTNVKNVIKANNQQLLIGDPSIKQTSSVSLKTWGQERIQTWIQELAQVRSNTGAFEEWQMISDTWQEAFKSNNEQHFQIVQYPSFISYPWVGLAIDEIKVLLRHDIYKEVPTYSIEEGYYPEGCESLMLYSDTPLNKGDIAIPQYGIVIDEFMEHIPDETVETGLNFHYNGPNNEAPQTLLLAVASPFQDINDWNEDMLQEIIYDTMDLMKIRMIDLESIQDYGFALPMTNFFNIPKVN